MTAGWRFLVDENLHPRIVTYLRKENIDASYVPDVLFEGADDEADILPYLTDHDCILVTNDLEHFGDRAPGEHEGIVLVYDGKLTAFEISPVAEGGVGGREAGRDPVRRSCCTACRSPRSSAPSRTRTPRPGCPGASCRFRPSW